MGADLDGLSAQRWDQDVELPGGDRVFPEGYDVVVRGLARGLDVRLGHVVDRVRRTAGGVVVRTDRGRFEGHGAVVALPLGVLARGSVAFDPPLPDAHRAAIGRIGVGVLDKIVLRFPRAFWPEEAHHLGMAPANDVQGIAGFLPLSPYGLPPILVGWVAGRQARALEAEPDGVVVSAALASLERVFPGRVPEPEQEWITRWDRDPFAAGSYSHLPPGARGEDHDRLAMPVDARLVLAGEHTCRAHPATVHGAYESGVRAAGQLLAPSRARAVVAST